MNSPNSVTLSGEAGPLEELAGLLEERGVFCRFLKVRYAFHSAQMDPIRDELLAALEGIRPRPASLPLFSTVTGRPIEGPELGPEYWWQNVRQTVRFAEGVERLDRARLRYRGRAESASGAGGRGDRVLPASGQERGRAAVAAPPRGRAGHDAALAGRRCTRSATRSTGAD